MPFERIKQEQVTQREEERDAAEKNQLRAESNARAMAAKRATAEANTAVNIRYLLELENYFWECAKDFASLTGLPVSSDSKSILPWRSSLGKRGDRLEVSFALPRKYSEKHVYGNYPNLNEVKLIATGDGIYFTGTLATYDSGSMGNSVTPSRRATYINEASVTSTHKTDDFSVEKAKRWLEAEFEKFYHALTNKCRG